MSTKSTILLSSVSTEDASIDSSFLYSDKQKGAGYHGSATGLHTVAYVLDEFAGTIKLQGTLEMYPGDDDWVDIDGTEIGGDSSAWNATESLNFAGNFIWIRAAYNLQSGTITSVRYNY